MPVRRGHHALRKDIWETENELLSALTSLRMNWGSPALAAALSSPYDKVRSDKRNVQGLIECSIARRSRSFRRASFCTVRRFRHGSPTRRSSTFSIASPIRICTSTRTRRQSRRWIGFPRQGQTHRQKTSPACNRAALRRPEDAGLDLRNRSTTTLQMQPSCTCK
jgi:hypothetical protein